MFADLLDRALSAVVEIRCKDLNQKGSGFLVSPDGHILTNNHVVAQLTFFQGTIQAVYASDIRVVVNGQEYRAQLLNSATSFQPIVFDYAILRVPQIQPQRYLEPLDLTSVRCGDEVLCLGFPLDFEQPVATHGIISAIVSRPSHFNALHHMRTIVSDALMQFGSSGGPMVHLSSGKVIGINTLRHPIADEIGERLQSWATHSGAVAFPLIRDLIQYVLKYTYAGLNHAVSIQYALNDPAFLPEEQELH